MTTKRRIDIIVTEKEFEILEQYCEDNGQTKTAVIRELIRTLKAHTANDRLADQKAKAVESLQGG
jgi:Replication regulatory protein RepB